MLLVQAAHSVHRRVNGLGCRVRGLTPRVDTTLHDCGSARFRIVAASGCGLRLVISDVVYGCTIFRFGVSEN